MDFIAVDPKGTRGRPALLLLIVWAVLHFSLPAWAAQVEVVPAPDCITDDHPCNRVSFAVTNEGPATVRGFSVTFAIESTLELCSGLSGIEEGSFLSGYCGTGCTEFQRYVNPDGTITVDCAILGAPCGPGGSGTLFTAEVGAFGAEGGAITITNAIMRDCVNGPIDVTTGPPAWITIDRTPPDAVTDLAAEQVKSDNDADGTTAVRLTFTPPADAAAVEVYRAGFGNHPEYDDAGGFAPPPPATYPPAPPWQLTAVSASGERDEVPWPNRDFWYYVVYVKDACGNVSGISNRTNGTLNYHLGDVSDGHTGGHGDNRVTLPDVSLLGYHYGITLAPADPYNYLDIGPTSDASVNGRPLTDNVVNFEDMILFAMNYEVPDLKRHDPAFPLSGPSERATAERSVRLSLEPPPRPVRAGWIVDVPVVLTGGAHVVQGIHAACRFDPVALAYVSSEVDPAIAGLGHFFKGMPSAGAIDLSLAVLGGGATIPADGPVMRMRFRALRDGIVNLGLSDADARDTSNRPRIIGPEPSPVPVRPVAAPPVEEFHAYLQPWTNTVKPDSLVEIRFEVDATARHFNGYEITIEYDRSVVHLVSVTQGSLFTEACPNRFTHIDSTATSVTYSHVLLCNGLSVDGPGVLSVFRFRADQYGTSPLTITSNPDQTFYDAGLYVWPGHPTYPRQVILHDSRIVVADPTSGEVREPSLGGLLTAPVVIPNPATGCARILFDLPNGGNVEVSIFDAAGRVVRRLLNDPCPAGRLEAAWDGIDEDGRPVPSGTYFCAIRSDGRTASRRIVRVR